MNNEQLMRRVDYLRKENGQLRAQLAAERRRGGTQHGTVLTHYEP